MSLWSLVAYLWTRQHDWQISKTITASGLGSNFQYIFLSNTKDKSQCTMIEWKEVRAILKRYGNMFANIKPWGPFDYVCLPPSSAIDITSTSIQIRTPFCLIHFGIDQQWSGMSSALPGGELILMADKRPRYETRAGIIRSTIKYNWLRAQSREMTKYQIWANDVVDQARQWFEAPKSGGTDIKSDFE